MLFAGVRRRQKNGPVVEHGANRLGWFMLSSEKTTLDPHYFVFPAYVNCNRY